MNSFLDKFLFLLDYWILLSTILLLVGGFILLYVRFKEPINSRQFIKRGIVLIAQFFVTFLLWIILHEALDAMVREELRDLLSQSDLTIKLKNKEVDPYISNEVIKELKQIKETPADHSHPLDKFEIQLCSSKQTIILSLAQDSELKTGYWVFWDKYITTEKRAFGGIHSKLFEH